MIGTQELVMIFAVVVLLFGASKLPELARSMGSSVGEFKKAQKESELNLREFEKSILYVVHNMRFTANQLAVCNVFYNSSESILPIYQKLKKVLWTYTPILSLHSNMMSQCHSIDKNSVLKLLK